ncbi:CubicO group peptidase (beta-lactamase class C family) [Haloactinopolyspora alba]|uniref:CubicO group peptidase (Beta-lactamase class C family) n=1 Tax=Haloactinopolyspora alba TaxID=648780 RepID=A0A2P8DJY3_9ACTN|nr:serine hydrolase [Haloactinopolyspora alba]PSK97535.1 CubicO group peptidase (beta-lactamase class C family) [Haloactinopolyspora alba]
MSARAARTAAVAVCATALSGTLLTATAGEHPAARFDRPADGFMAPGTVLHDAAPGDVGLDPDRIDALTTDAASFTRPAPGEEHPLYASSVVLAAHAGAVVAEDAAGWSLRYADGEGTPLPADERIRASTDTIYDLASVSKLFTTIVVLQQVEAGRIELDAPVADYLPAFAANGKQDITVRQLLTHTSGLVPWIPLWSNWATVQERIDAVMNTTPRTEPGTAYDYSDLNMITAGLVAEEVTGRGLDELVRDGITEPLGMVDTGYNPSPDELSRIAATEYQASPDRGMVHGEVHDENAWSLGGVAGHAGVFGTARDLARLAQAILNGGVYDGARILEKATVETMLTNENTEFPGDAHGLGFELDQRWYMDALTAPSTAGHTGYTGTSMVIDPQSRSFVILLTNRVHPSRNWGSVNPARRAVAHHLAYSMAVPPASGSTAWAAHDTGSTTSTLDLPVQLRDDSTLTFDLFADTESTDPFRLEISTDGGATWDPVPFTARRGGSSITAGDGVVSGYHDRRWWRARADLPDVTGSATLRWRYGTDPLYTGRGVVVDGVRVHTRGLPTFHGEQHPERFDAKGWTLTSR